MEILSLRLPGLSHNPRTIRVYTPPGYAAAGQRYPVLYLHDGQNLFAPGAFGDWLVDETLDQLVAEGVTPGLIVVGVDSSPARWDEYSPWVNRRLRAWIDPERARPMQGGAGSAYLAALVAVVKPAIDARWSTLPGAAHTAIGGSSMGGLISLYAGIARPDVFSKVMAMSPAVWFAEDGGRWLEDNQLLRYLNSLHLPRGVRCYLDAGAAEASRPTDPAVVDRRGAPLTYARAYVEGARAVAAALAAGGVPAENLKFVVAPGAFHHESAWAARLAPALAWLFEWQIRP
ncbi:MAG: alpha/beta hydrolase [Anaerolineales bacterium]|nr:alpha/beta hydrolase [Anaerolineales bacterium]